MKEEEIDLLLKKLRNDKSFFKDILRTQKDWIWEVNKEGIYTYCSERVKDFLGYSPDEIIGKAPIDFMPSEEATRVSVIFTEIVENQDPIIDLEKWTVHKNGELVCLLTNGVPFYDKDGNWLGYRGTDKKITVHKNAEEKQYTTHQRLLDIIEFLPDATFVIDNEKRVIAWNRTIEEMTGIHKQDIINKGNYAYAIPFYGKRRPILIDLISIEDKKTESLYDYIKRSNNTIGCEVFIPSMYGGVGAHLWAIAAPLLDKEGNQYGAIESIRDITEHKKVEKKIREERDKMKQYLDIVGVLFVAINAKEEVILINQKGCEILGYKQEEIIGKNYFDNFIPERMRNEVRTVFQKLIAGDIEPVESFENPILTKTGEEKIIAWHNSNIKNKEGKIIASLSSGEDITEHKNTEKKRKESEEKFRYLFENSPNSIILLNFEGVIIDCNNTTEKIFGYKKEELINKFYSQNPIIPPKYLPEIKNKSKEIYKGEVPKPIKIQVYKKDGSPIWVNMQFALFKIGKKKFMQLIIQDISARKKSEEEIMELEKSLQEIHALNETAPLGIFLLNQKGEILKANRETENVFNYNREELLTHNIYELFDPEFIDVIKKHYEEDIYDLSIPNKVEALIKAKHGNLLYVEVSSTILRIEDQIIIQSFFSDISDRKNFEKNREMLFDQLLASLDIKSRFMATMSHELRTPLNAILGFSQLLLDGSYGDLNVDQQDFINDINSAGDHLLSLINSILDISKIEAGKLKLEIQKFDLNELIVEINAVIKPLYSNKNLEFKVEGINEHDYLIADPVRFKQILYNILSNAFKFTEKGNVSLRGIQRIDHWEFQIKDTGVGIAKKDYDVVFREFGRVEGDKIKQVQGTGLGLALTKRLINLHGGEIWFESKWGNGTTFFFTIPKITLTEEKLHKTSTIK